METEQCRLRSKPAGLFNHLKKIRAFLKNRINIIGGRRSHNLPDSKQTKEYFGRYLPLVSLVTTPDLIRGLLFRKRKILLENNCRRRSGTDQFQDDADRDDEDRCTLSDVHQDLLLRNKAIANTITQSMNAPILIRSHVPM